jgi:hypothetical protein
MTSDTTTTISNTSIVNLRDAIDSPNIRSGITRADGPDRGSLYRT